MRGRDIGHHNMSGITSYAGYWSVRSTNRTAGPGSPRGDCFVYEYLAQRPAGRHGPSPGLSSNGLQYHVSQPPARIRVLGTVTTPCPALPGVTLQTAYAQTIRRLKS